MDHLPVPRQACQVVEVRYLRGHDYGDLDFFQYPATASIDVDCISIGLFEPKSADEVAAFIQSWLFFGLLNQILDRTITHHEFLNGDTVGKQRIDTTSLPSHLARWKHQYAGLERAQQLAEEERVCRTLREARRVINEISSTRSLSEAPDFLGPELELSIWICLQTLEFELFRWPGQRVVDDHGTRICTSLLGKLVTNNYCPNQIDMLAHCMDVTSLYYVSLLGPPKIKKNHAGCTVQQCLVDQVDESSYETKHTRESCECHFVRPDLEKVHAVLRKGGIPILSPNFDSEGITDSLDVFEAKRGLRYVALSHVWSDGLGNAQENALPRCQVDFLFQAIKQIDSVHGFWIDTLCVPLRPAESRRSAIRLMRQTYSEAYAVLVLDHGIMQIESSVSPEELFMRIACSSWLRRLWTFQEGLMAKTLRFLNNEIVNIRIVFDLMTKAVEYPNVIALEASAFFRCMRSDWDWTDTDKRMTFGSLWESLQWRSTSKRTDEAICLAPLFGIDVGLILELPEEERLKKLYSLQKSFPPYLIFSRGARMSEVGYRWAPPSLMIPRALETAKMYHMADEGKWHPEGLLVSFPGFVFEMPGNGPQNIEMSIFFKDHDTGIWYLMNGECDDSLRSENRWDEMYFKGVSSAAVILSCPLAQLADMLWDAVLVTIHREEDGVLFCHFIASVNVKREHRWSIKEEQPVDWSPSIRNMVRTLNARSVASEQKWCVG